MTEFAPGSGSWAQATRVALINPNTSVDTTEAMRVIAQDSTRKFRIEAHTAPFGASLIQDEEHLMTAGQAVEEIATRLDPLVAGVVVAAFGDPGLERIRRLLPVPVVGIAEASMCAATANGRRYSVVTTTPRLAGAIRRRARIYGAADQLVSVRLTGGDPVRLMSRPDDLLAELAKAIDLAIGQDGAEAIVVGGGPLATAAKVLATGLPVPMIEPIPSAIARLEELLWPSASQGARAHFDQ